MLHDPNLWVVLVLVGAFGLLADTAWRSWHFAGRVADSGWFVGAPAPMRSPWPIGPRMMTVREPWRDLVDWPSTGDGHMRNHRVAAALAPPPVAPVETAGATEEWSPIAAVTSAGRSGEDRWSERLQAYDAALRWIDAAPRMEDGTPCYAAVGLNTAGQLEMLIAGSQQLHAYRELRIGDTGNFTARDHMELEQLLARV